MASEQDLNREKELLKTQEERLKAQQKLNELESDSIGLSTSLVDSIKEIQGIKSKTSTFDQNILSINKKISNEILGQKSGLSDISSVQKQIKKNSDLTEKAKKTESAITSSIVGYDKLRLDLANKRLDEISHQQSIQSQLLQQAEQGKEFDQEAYNLSIQAQATAENSLNLLTKKMSSMAQQAAFTRQNTLELERQNQQRKEEIEKIKKVNENLGITGSILKGTQGFMNKMGLGALSDIMGFDQINKDLEEYSASLEEGGDNFDSSLTSAQKKQMVMNKSFGLIGNAAKKALLDPVAKLAISLKVINFLFSSIKDAFLQSDKIIGDMAKGLNMSYSEALDMKQELTTSANTSEELFVTSKGMAETLVAINQTLGTNVMLNKEDLATFTKLREVAGLTNEELMGIQSLTLANGKSLEENTGEILAQAKISSVKNGVILNEKDILKDIKDVSAATTLSLGKNPGLIAEAVSTAKSFGLEMSKVEAIASSLLEFESSIESELQAELLLGRNINLEKARLAALNNDIETLSEEIANQIGDAAEFGKMNVIQQDALAKSVGMNREELAKTLFIQDQLAGATGKQAEEKRRILESQIASQGLEATQNQLAKDGFETLENQASMQDRFNASVEKLKEIFTTVAEAIIPIFDALMPVFNLVGEIIKIIEPFMGTIMGIIGGAAAGSAIPVIGTLAGGIIGGIAGGASDISRVGDLNSPANGKTQVSTKEGSLFELSPNDDIIAAPGMSQAIANQQQPVVVNNDNKETNMLLKQILNKQGTVKMNATEVGTAFSVNTYEVQ